MLWRAAVTQLRQMSGPGPGRSSLVRGAGLAVDVGVECSWHSHVEVFQQMGGTAPGPSVATATAWHINVLRNNKINDVSKHQVI